MVSRSNIKLENTFTQNVCNLVTLTYPQLMLEIVNICLFITHKKRRNKAYYRNKNYLFSPSVKCIVS